MTEDELKYFFNTFRYQLPQTSLGINLHLLLTSTFGVKTFLSQITHVKSAFPQTLSCMSYLFALCLTIQLSIFLRLGC